MAVSILMNTGNNALLATQVALNVTGNNIANVDTEGYSRQSVRFDESTPLNRRPGQIGQGAYAAEVYRNFNRFVENSYLERFTQQQRWSEESTIMASVENIFNEANRDGIASQFQAFLSSWNKLAGTPDDQATREALLAQAENLALLLRDTKRSLQSVQNEMDSYIAQGVKEANRILDEIVAINKQIAVLDVPGVNTPNALYDERDRLVRELSSYLDVRVDDKGGADFSLFTESGQPLISDNTAFKFLFQNATWEKQTQSFLGDLNFSGTDSYEYTLEFVDGRNFRVSLDGGKSWLRDEDGRISTFTAPKDGEPPIRVKNLDISFTGTGGDSVFHAGDKFTIVPKTGLYWDSPTRDPLNVTPQAYDNGAENPDRITGGKLAAYFDVRDTQVGRYIDKLDAFSKTLIWEVNSLHSQGSGLKSLTNAQGTYSAGHNDEPLGSLRSGLAYSQRLTEGNLTLHFYDAANGQSISPEGLKLDFGGGANFDPQKHTLADVAQAFNNLRDPNGNPVITASIEGGKLHLTAAEGVTFKMGTDSTGLLAALGLNTFFQGSGAGDISLNPLLKNNTEYVNAQSVDGQHEEANAGDGIIAARIAQLATKELTISTTWENSKTTLGNYYATLVGLVGSDTANANFNNQYNTSLADELYTQATSITGVNMDEEMTNLIRFQHSYTAAAKLITTADQMLETILGLKQ